jgi:MtN3 and saliva related transmembrane protein
LLPEVKNLTLRRETTVKWRFFIKFFAVSGLPTTGSVILIGNRKLASEINNLCAEGVAKAGMGRFNKVTLVVLVQGLLTLYGCQDLVPHDTRSLLIPSLHRSEVFGFLAGFGTTFAAMPDLVAMLRRRSIAGINPRMAAIMAAFQILWVYYGLLIASRPVILWNVIAVLVNSLSVGAYLHFIRKERAKQKSELES